MATADYSPSTPTIPPAPASSDPTKTLLQGLSRLSARRSRQLLIRALMLWATLGLALASAGVFAYRLYLVDGEPWMVAVPLVLTLLMGAIRGWQARRTPFEAALDADRALGLKENLSSALAFARPDLVQRSPIPQTSVSVRAKSAASVPVRKPLKAHLKLWPQSMLAGAQHRLQKRPLEVPAVHAAPTQWVPFLVSEAAGRAQGLPPQTVYPWQWKKRDGVFLLLLIAFIGVCLMPNLNWLRSAQQVKEVQQLQEPAKTLQIAAKKVEDDKKLSENPEAKRMAKKMAALGRKMMRGHMGRRDALVAMAQLKRDLKQASTPQQQQQNGQSQFDQFEKEIQQQQMQSPEGKDLQKALGNKDLEEAAKQLDALAKKLESGKMTAEEKKQAAQDLKKAADALEKQGGEQNKSAADQLRKAAEELQKQAQGQNGKQGQQNQQGQQPSQQGKKSGQNQQKQGQSGQSQSQQNQQGQQQKQAGGSSQSQSGGNQAQQGQQQGNQAGASALRQMANSMRGSQMGDSQAMQNMLNKIREAEQQASQSGSQAGQGEGQGQGQSGQGDGRESMTPGKDLKPTDPHGEVGGGAGMGQRSHATGSKSGGGVSDKKSNRTGDKRRWADVWSDRLPNTRKRLDQIRGKLGDGGEVDSLQTQTEAKGGPVNTPYYDVYESYKKDAEDAVSKEQVPPAYRQPVKNYFDSLKPNK